MTWSQQKKIIASDYQSSDNFGCSLAFVIGIIYICGAPYEDQKGTNAGAAYIFYAAAHPGIHC